MKKITRIFALALAFVMAFALQAPVNAAEEASVQAVNQAQTQVDTQYARSITARITYLSYNSVGISFSNPESEWLEVQLRDRNGKVLQTNHNFTYSTFSLSKNKLYSFRFRRVEYSNGAYVPYTNWSSSISFSTDKHKVSQVGKSRKFRIKTPKVAGIKNYKIYMSMKKNGGWKKVKTVKAGKSVVISKFKGKSLKNYKYYYYKIVPNKGKTTWIGYVYLYKYTTFR